jgi:hypothetical protein
MQKISICLSELPKEKMKTVSNGKIYVNLIVADRREPDQFGNNLTVYADQSKEEREARVDKIYVGAGRTYSFTSNSHESVDDLTSINEKTDLPWSESQER